MKRLGIFILSIIMVISLLGCANGGSSEKSQNQVKTEASADKQKTVNSTSDKGKLKTAVVYFSATGNTKAVAEMIAAATGADIFEITPKQPYTADDLNYHNIKCRASIEKNDGSIRPAIGNDLSATTKYDVVYLGYPIWWKSVPRIMQTYLETYNLSNAKIYAFCTSGSTNIDGSVAELKKWYPKLKIVDAKRLDKANKREIKEFCGR